MLPWAPSYVTSLDEGPAVSAQRRAATVWQHILTTTMGPGRSSLSAPGNVPGAGRSSLWPVQPASSSPPRTRVARSFLLQIFQFQLTGGDVLVYCVQKDSEVHS